MIYCNVHTCFNCNVFMYNNLDVDKAILEKRQAEPYIAVAGNLADEFKECFLVTDHKIVTTHLSIICYC